MYRVENVHEPCIFPSLWRHQACHRCVRELPGIALLGDEVRELGILGIDVLEEHAEGVADVLVMLQAERLACIAHDVPVVTDHVVRLTSFFRNSLLQLSLYHPRYSNPCLALPSSVRSTVGMFEAAEPGCSDVTALSSRCRSDRRR